MSGFTHTHRHTNLESMEYRVYIPSKRTKDLMEILHYGMCNKLNPSIKGVVTTAEVRKGINLKKVT